VLRCFRGESFYTEGLPEGRRHPILRVWRHVGEQLEFGANHLHMMSLARRFVTLCGEECAPLVVA
jgi:hypothetical protein